MLDHKAPLRMSLPQIVYQFGSCIYADVMNLLHVMDLIIVHKSLSLNTLTQSFHQEDETVFPPDYLSYAN